MGGGRAGASVLGGGTVSAHADSGMRCTINGEATIRCKWCKFDIAPEDMDGHCTRNPRHRGDDYNYMTQPEGNERLWPRRTRFGGDDAAHEYLETLRTRPAPPGFLQRHKRGLITAGHVVAAFAAWAIWAAIQGRAI